MIIEKATGTKEEKLIVHIEEMRESSKAQLRQQRTRWIDSIRDYRPQSESQNLKDGVGHRKLQKKRASNDLLENGSGNRIASIIDQQISMIYENNPRAFFLPKDTDDLSFAKELESLTKWRLDRINLRQKLIQGGLYSKLFGFQAFHVYWDDHLPSEPDVNVRVLWPESFIIDPKLDSQNPEEGDFVGYDRFVNLEFAKMKWKDKAKEIEEEATKADTSWVTGNNGDSDQLSRELGHINQGTFDRPMSDKEMQVRMTVMWFKDYTEQTFEVETPIETLLESGEIIEEPEVGVHVWATTGEIVTPESMPVEKLKQPMYPYGRYIIKIGNILLEDYAWGYDPETDEVKPRSWGIALTVNKLIAGVWYGQDECEALRADQNIADVCLQNITEHAYTNIHPKTEYDMSKIKTDPKLMKNGLSNRILLAKGPNAMKVHPAGQLSPDVFSLLKVSTTNMEITAGLSGQSIGREGASQQTATEIQALDRASRGKVGITSTFVDALVNRVYALTAETIQFEYDEGRVIRVNGESRESQMQAITMTQQLKSIRFDVEVEAGSTLPNDKQQKKVEANELFQVVGLPALPNLMDAYEVPNKEDMLQQHSDYQLFLQFGPLLQDPNVQAMIQQYAQELEEQQSGATQGGSPPQ